MTTITPSFTDESIFGQKKLLEQVKREFTGSTTELYIKLKKVKGNEKIVQALGMVEFEIAGLQIAIEDAINQNV